MSEYVLFEFKRIIKRKSNYVILFLSMAFITIFFAMNMRSQNILQETLSSQIKIFEEDRLNSAEYIQSVDPLSEEYRYYEARIAIDDQNIEKYQKTIQNFKNQDWALFYQNYGELLDEQVRTLDNSTENSSEETQMNEMIDVIKRQKSYIQYLEKHNLPYENQDYPVFGLTFTTSMLQNFLPILLIAVCIYVVSQIYTLDYYQDISISHLLPMSKYKLMFVKLALGTLISLGIVFILLAFSLLLSALCTMNLGFENPVLVQSAANDWHVISSITLFKRWILLVVVYLMNINIFMYLLSQFIREEVALLLTSFCLLIGLAYLPNFMSMLQPIAQFLPTTYIHFIDVVNGSLAYKWGNMSISLNTGLFVLIFMSLICYVICLFLEKLNIYPIQKRKMKS